MHEKPTPTGIAKGLPPTEPTPSDPRMESIAFPTEEPSFREAFFAWDKLRLIYNGVLAVVVLCILTQVNFDARVAVKIASSVVIGGLEANLCFCVGPIAEGYLCWLRLPHQTTRWVLFLWGCIISIIVLIESTRGWVLPLAEIAPP